MAQTTSTGTGVPFLDIASLGTDVLGSIFSVLAGGEQRRFSRRQREGLERSLPILEKGISQNQITALTPALYRAALPRINAIAGKAISRFGRSGKAAGLATRAASESISGPLFELLGRLPFENMRLRGQAAQIRSNLV